MLTGVKLQLIEDLMAATSTPHFQNAMGLAVIEVGSKEFMCIGALPPFDHPHVFIDMGMSAETVCPYCSTLYKFNAKLGAGAAKPAEAIWHDDQAAA